MAMAVIVLSQLYMTQYDSLFTLNECIFPADTKSIVQTPVRGQQGAIYWHLIVV